MGGEGLVARIMRLLVACGLLAAVMCPAAEYWVAPDGKADAAGTKEAPWDIASALGGGHAVRAGDKLWLRGGTYRHPNRKPGSTGYEVRLAGTKEKPVWVLGVPGERVTIDGGLSVVAPSTGLVIRDLEILVSENLTQSRVSKETGSSPQDLNRPWGGLNIYSGRDCRYENLIIHDNAQGVSFWRGATDSEIHGCIIYDNGWSAPDRGHGHAVYTQNQDGVKTISDCIMTGGYGYSMHAYGSKNAWVDNYLLEGNIAYSCGPFLVGGGRPSRGIRVLRNFLFDAGMQIGYDAPENEDCEVRGNVILNGGLSVNRFKTAVNEDNLVVGRNAPRPKGFLAVLRPDKYDADRANLVVYNRDKAAEVSADAGDWLRHGTPYELMDPKDFYGKPVQSGKSQDGKIIVKMTGEFAAFVVFAVRDP